ncbi:hypothetical protein, partial [Sphingobacterium deserti]|uniref:hypothetical protein n=1 Tax=Sphingobacterium deserti TaxID=1229276 RepID=UPI0019D39371
AALPGFRYRENALSTSPFPTSIYRFSIVPPLRSGAKIELWHIPCKYSPLISSPNHASTCGSAGYFFKNKSFKLAWI